jgi:FKBP-type peptidyl-prolyl cis-trans isomerase FklB
LVTSVAAGTNVEGVKFLQENAKKEGVITLKSGLQYKVLRRGDGTDHPTIDSPCSCHYEGTLIDGTKFDSSYDRGEPTSFAPNQVIKGWTEVMQLMVEGDKFEIYVPSELGYGDQGSPPKIPGGSVLVFKMEIIKIEGGKVPALQCKASTGDECNDKEKAYIAKTKSWDAAKVTGELNRLDKVADTKMNPELATWMKRRVHILKQLNQAAGDTEL